MSCVVCIDFTGSNGDPNTTTSLHYRSPNNYNQYQQAIQSVCHILMNYDTDKMVPTYGFGAMPCFPPPGMNLHGVSHFFPCSGQWENCEGYGVPGIFQHYNTAINYVRLSGPTYFAPLLGAVRDFTQQSFAHDKYNYSILLILTDGAIHDMQDTKDCIIDLTHLPISIIIVGIGGADFGKMDELDGDDKALRSRMGNSSIRDIVQFVPFNKYKGDPANLAAEVLREVPKQVTEFYRQIETPPKAAPNLHMSQLNQMIGQKEFTRDGKIKDGDYYKKHPDELKGQFLGAVGLDPSIQAQIHHQPQQQGLNQEQYNAAYGNIGNYMAHVGGQNQHHVPGQSNYPMPPH